MHMRKSRVLRQMRNGQVATSIKLNLSDPRNVEIAAMSGFDCIWIDLEHVPNNMTSVEDTVRAAKIYDVDVLTRVSKGCYSDFIRPLEGDSTGIMVPHLMSLEEAKQIVYYTKFHPIGRRPIDGGNADGKYCLVDPLDYIKEANEERFTVVQIEDPEPVAELEEICALPGIDMIFFGPADFSQGIGDPSGKDPEIDRVRRLVAKTARKYGKFAGTVGGPGNFDALVEMGYTFINTGADVIALCDYYRNIAQKVSGRTIAEVK
ncbi:MAG: aldolase [Ruminococcaceae bacterium]|nr:aldolase [Oscillospiraceae bacterium]